MKTPIRFAVLAVGVVVTGALFATCGGGGTGSSGEAATIDLAAVETGAEELSTFIPICHVGSTLRLPGTPKPAGDRIVALMRVLELGRGAGLRAGGNPQGILDPTKPGDEFGDCGGRVTFPTYSHSNGTTTATLEFENFCNIDDETGEHEIADGTISLVDHGTPGSFGPVTTSLDADGPGGVSVDAETAGGTTVRSQRISFTDFVLDVGVPGGLATQANPDELTIDELTLTDLLTGKSYLQTDYIVTQYYTSNGNQVSTFSGRGHRSNGDYYDIRTTTPQTTTLSGDILGGQLTITGAGNSQAVMTLVPGPTLKATMTVNGVPVTNVPACQ
jgi:hypothetical protein